MPENPKSKIARTTAPSHREVGAALVIVLSILVVLVLLVVGLLSRVSTERRASSVYSNGAITRNLADVAVNLVQAQINDATTLGTTYAWASQPGMVRTFDQSGNLFRAYKLYSASDMMATAVDITADLPPATWKTDPAGWVDLNEPVQSADNAELIYPILDPSAAVAQGSVGPVEGFAINSTPGYNAGAAASSSNNPAPMPTRWLYVLQDGQLIFPTSVSENTANFAGSSITPSKNNPIIGRVAFWTDDDSAKVNINTAGEGTMWDTPRANTTQEYQLADSQPTNTEWQRYPGHPATTALSAVFPWGVADDLAVERSLSLTPFYQWGGSKAGTETTLTITAPPSIKADHIYSSIDEILFNPDRSLRTLFQADTDTAQAILKSRKFFLTAHSRAPETNLFNLPKIAIWPIYKLTDPGDPSSFDLTRTTGFDRQIAKCATIAGIPYYFQREDADDVFNDFQNIDANLNLYSYLSGLTEKPIPGFGAAFSDKYGQNREQILTAIFDYIRCTNLYDDFLALGKQFTEPRGNLYLTTQGHGYVAPLIHPGNGSKGYGRFHTISELGFLIIATAAADDPATPGVEESMGSNYPPGTPAADLPVGARINYTLPPYIPPEPSTALTDGQTRIQFAFLVEMFSPSVGWTQAKRDCLVRITGLDSLAVETSGTLNSLGFSNSIDLNFQPITGDQVARENTGGGMAGIRSSLVQLAVHTSPRADARTSPQSLVSVPLTVNTADGIVFHGGTVRIEIFPYSTKLAKHSTDYAQQMDFIIQSGTFPSPNLVSVGTLEGMTATTDSYAHSEGQAIATAKENWWGFFPTPGVVTTPREDIPLHEARRMDYLSDYVSFNGIQGSTYRAAGIPSNPGSGAIIRDGFDVVRTIYPRHGDYRLVAADRQVPTAVFQFDNDGWGPGAGLQYHYLSDGLGTGYLPGFQGHTGYDNGVAVSPFRYADIPTPYTMPDTGDFDTAPSYVPDGPYINKPDEGNVYRHPHDTNPEDVPYFFRYGFQYTPGALYFSPNRIIPSPLMFGSLPSGAVTGIPWQTLLFRPQKTHFGAQSPKDHLMLEYFWMPVVEPYTISEPFSTAGKINLNYQILPFTYIERSTGIRAVLKSEKIAALPNSGNFGLSYKTKGTAASVATQTRIPIDINQTLSQFADKFTAGTIFRSASEICDIHLIPEGTTVSAGDADATMKTFWENHALTGENLRERPYATIYPRLTTKSNTFTIHMWVQSVRRTPSSDPLIFDGSKDKISGEYRGSSTIERYVDPNNASIPDYASNIADLDSLPPLDTFYRWRVVQTRRFLP